MSPQDLLAGVEASAVASHLRSARWTYALVNAGHVLGIALLIGAVAPLDLRLIGAWRNRPLGPFLAVQRPMAMAGAALAIATGLSLFTVHAREYAATGLFQLKLALIAIGLANAALHAGPRLETMSRARQGAAGALSLGVWIAVLLCGRMIGYL